MEKPGSLLVSRIVDIAERIFLVLLAIPFLWAFASALPSRPTLILVAISESLGVALILTRRTGDLSMRALPVVAAFAGTALSLLVRPVGVQLLPTIVCTALLISGLALSIAAKLYLNRSFGLIAANRGIKVSGPYRFVRHPMYVGYIVNQIGFLMMSFSITNLAIYLVTWFFQVVRVQQEELVLSRDAEYRQFSRRVPTRLVPGIY